MRDERDEIRSRIDLVDLVGQRVLLKRAGKHWKGLCPFHDDRNPSFYVSSDTGRYKCWSCGEGGDIFTWVMKTQNVEFGDALRILAAQAGIELTSRRPEDGAERLRQQQIMGMAQEFFRDSLKSSSIAKDYCRARGLDDAVLDQWGIGYSPPDDHALATRLRKAKIQLAEARSLFLVEDDGSGAYFDKFRGRLMFPIHDERGELVAFGGRALGDAQPKYVNSSDTPLFRKSRVLYGLHRAKDHIGKSRRAVLVEGYLDVIACHRAGVETAVASLGTSLAEEHAKLLRRWCDEAVVLYDADAAGEKAANRACELLQAQGLSVQIALLPKGKDPDTLLKEAGPAAVQEAARGGLTPTEFRLLQLERSVDPQSDEFWNSVVDILAETISLAEAERHFAHLRAKYLDGRPLVEDQLRMRVRAAQRGKSRGAKEQPKVASLSFVRLDVLPAEAVILKALMENLLRHEAYRSIAEGAMESPIATQFQADLLQAFPDGPPAGRPVEWLNELPTEAARDLLADVALKSSDDGPLVRRRLGDVTPSEFADALHALQLIKERREVESIKSGEITSEDAAVAFERLRAKHDREAKRWES